MPFDGSIAVTDCMCCANGMVKDPGPAPISSMVESGFNTLLKAAYTLRPKS